MSFDIINDCLKLAISNIRKAERLLAASDCSPAGVESEICPSCEGFGRIQVRLASEGAGMHASYPTKCKTCGGTGRVGKAKPQENSVLGERAGT